MLPRHLITAVVAVALTALPAVACAAQGPPIGRPGPAARSVYADGYAAGQRAGLNDARRGEPYRYSDERVFRDARPGPWRGDNRYRAEFRRGFADGYRAGYTRAADDRYRSRRGPAGRRFDLAARNGFDDGYAAGLDDGRDGRRFDPVSERRYRSGDHGYERGYGSREVYKVNYRDAFRAGYEEGYRDGRSYRR